MAKYISLCSGSSGNCSVIEENGKFILIDLGASARSVNCSLKELGLRLENLEAIFITHDHPDHIKGLKVFLKNLNTPVYAASGAVDYLCDNLLIPNHTFIEDASFCATETGQFSVSSFDVPHDAHGCIGYRITTALGHTMSLATDLGYLSSENLRNLSGVDLCVIESNYDDYMLKTGPYPYITKQRIASNTGHLSNRQCSAAVSEIVKSGTAKIHLCHLSANNNTHELAVSTVQSRLLAEDISPKDYQLKVNLRHEITTPTEF